MNGRVGQPRQAPGDLGLADAGRADHQDVLGRDLVAQRLVDLDAAPAVAQGDGDRALGVVLADDVLVQLVRRSPAGCISDMVGSRLSFSVQFFDDQIVVGVDADVGGDAQAPSRRSRGPPARCSPAARGPRPGRKAPPEPIAIRPCSGSITSPVPEMISERLCVGHAQQRLEAAQHAVGAPVLGQFDRGAGQVAVSASPACPRSARTG